MTSRTYITFACLALLWPALAPAAGEPKDAPATAAPPPAAAIDSAAADLQRVKALLTAGDIQGALDLAARHQSRQEFAQIYNHLYQARQYRGSTDQHYHAHLGAAATAAGLHDLAVASYRKAVEIEAATSPDNKSNRVAYAHAAAMASMRKGDTAAAVALFRQMEGYSQGWVKEKAAELAAAVEQFAAAPADVDRRIHFAREFWAGTGTGFSGGQYDDAIALLTATLEAPHRPTPAQRRQIYTAVTESARQARASEVAERFVTKLADEFSGSDETARALITDAAALAATRKHVEARARLDRVVAPEANYAKHLVLEARTSLAAACGASGDEEAMVNHLKAVASDPAAPDVRLGRDVMDTSSFRQGALMSLGRHYQSKGDFDAALVHYRAYAPGSWCKNCYEQMVREREARIAECLAAKR